MPILAKNKKRPFAIIFILFIIIAAAVYACFFSPLLSIKNILIEGLEETRTSCVENPDTKCAADADYIKKTIMDLISKRRVLMGIIPADNLMLAGKNWFLKLQTSEIKNFSIEKNFIERTLSVYFEPRKEILSWCAPKTDYRLQTTDYSQRTTDYGAPTPTLDSETMPTSTSTIEWECFYADKDGVLFKKSSFIESPYFIQIKDLTDLPISIGDAVDRQIIDFAQKIFLNAGSKNLTLSQFEIENYESREIIGETESFKILFALEKDPGSQIDNLFAVLRQEIKENQNRLLYIDLRNDNKVFFKYK